ncbi:hypothetical protein D9613_010040 [Agrocybe pediades]|uniref:Macro-like domain-containing protein n=1 Tax=Agrocybe pediades TaxID=84607 RepID=A0A8H4QWK2_9AGAR|nr:hypothetical protein D9613_010040 [Agrocybe pediades]
MKQLRFILLDKSGDLVREWTKAFGELVPEAIRQKFEMVTSKSPKLSDLEEKYKHFDCIVSPANSYGRLDGGFDAVISDALSPDDFFAPTRLVQSVLYKRWRGYLPPGVCMLVPLQGQQYPTLSKNPHGCSFIALCPTMRVPENIQWNKEIVYNLMWSLLVAVDEHNDACSTADINPSAQEVLMTGLGTGVGGISAEKCARQMALAVRDYANACENRQQWSAVQWDQAERLAEEVRSTDNL